MATKTTPDFTSNESSLKVLTAATRVLKADIAFAKNGSKTMEAPAYRADKALLGSGYSSKTGFTSKVVKLMAARSAERAAYIKDKPKANNLYGIALSMASTLRRINKVAA